AARGHGVFLMARPETTETIPTASRSNRETRSLHTALQIAATRFDAATVPFHINAYGGDHDNYRWSFQCGQPAGPYPSEFIVQPRGQQPTAWLLRSPLVVRPWPPDRDRT